MYLSLLLKKLQSGINIKYLIFTTLPTSDFFFTLEYVKYFINIYKLTKNTYYSYSLLNTE